MKAVILAGGFGTRINAESLTRPKPMEEIGGRPILWHILKMYSRHGIFDFIIPLGSQGYMIKEYFRNYFLHTSDVTFDITRNSMEVHERTTEPWRVTLVETGEETATGGRIKKIASYLQGEDDFCMTYGDNVSDVDISELVRFHQAAGKLATLTAVQTVPRFGVLRLEGPDVQHLHENPSHEDDWVNGGYYVLSRKVLDQIPDDPTARWERGPLEALAKEKQLNAYRHSGFWQPMDTVRDKAMLDKLWSSGTPPWKTW